MLDCWDTDYWSVKTMPLVRDWQRLWICLVPGMTLNCLYRVISLPHPGTNDRSYWSALKQQLINSEFPAYTWKWRQAYFTQFHFPYLTQYSAYSWNVWCLWKSFLIVVQWQMCNRIASKAKLGDAAFCLAQQQLVGFLFFRILEQSVSEQSSIRMKEDETLRTFSS